MNALNYQQQYMKTKVETASPGELTLLLYEELYRKLNMAKSHLSKGNQIDALERIHGARAILYELLGSLDYNYEISGQLRDLYMFYLSLLNTFVLKKDPELIEQVMEFAQGFAATWKEAVLIAKNSREN